MFDLIDNQIVPRKEFDLEHEHEIYDVKAKEWIDPKILLLVGGKWYRYCE